MWWVVGLLVALWALGMITGVTLGGAIMLPLALALLLAMYQLFVVIPRDWRR